MRFLAFFIAILALGLAGFNFYAATMRPQNAATNVVETPEQFDGNELLEGIAGLTTRIAALENAGKSEGDAATDKIGRASCRERV